MARYIDAEKAFNEITDLAGKANTRGEYNAYWKSAKQLEKQPTEDVKKVVHGKWIRRYICGEDPLECSNCGNTANVFGFNFCPNCGADMRG